MSPPPNGQKGQKDFIEQNSRSTIEVDSSTVSTVFAASLGEELPEFVAVAVALAAAAAMGFDCRLMLVASAGRAASSAAFPAAEPGITPASAACRIAFTTTVLPPLLPLSLEESLSWSSLAPLAAGDAGKLPSGEMMGAAFGLEAEDME
jgi:hypothetical protein